MMRPHPILALALSGAFACVFKPGSEYDSSGVLALDICGVCEGDCGEDGCALEVAANGVDEALITILFPGGSAKGGKVVLTTTLGALDPTKEGTEAKTVELSTPAEGTVSAVLHAGTSSGDAVVRAAIGGVFVEQTVEIAPAGPSSLDLIAGTYVLAAGSLATDLNVFLYGDAGAAVSAGVAVQLLACSESGAIADVPRRIQTAGPNTGLVTAKVTLNKKGAELTDEIADGTPSETLHVYAYSSDEAGLAADLSKELADKDCAGIEALLENTVYDAVELTVRRRPG